MEAVFRPENFRTSFDYFQSVRTGKRQETDWNAQKNIQKLSDRNTASVVRRFQPYIVEHSLCFLILKYKPEDIKQQQKIFTCHNRKIISSMSLKSRSKVYGSIRFSIISLSCLHLKRFFNLYKYRYNQNKLTWLTRLMCNNTGPSFRSSKMSP